MHVPDNSLAHLRRPDGMLGLAMARPRALAWAGLALLVLLAWAYLAILSAAVDLGGFGAPVLLDRLALWSGIAALAAVCTDNPASWSPGEAAFHVSMWLAMGVAMMLPTAAPMLRTYAEIADTAAARRRQVVSPTVLAAGYLAVWSAFALAMTAVQWGLGLVGAVSGSGRVVSGALAALVLAVAGLYQLSAAKAGCLVKCANPFPFLFANWTDRAAGVFQLGVRQGLHCLACCWALMLTMFAVGVMNIAWIAGLAVVMTAEKLIGARWFSRLVGLGLMAWAGAAVGGLM